MANLNFNLSVKDIVFKREPHVKTYTYKDIRNTKYAINTFR